MHAIDLALLDFVQRLKTLLMAKDILEFDADYDPVFSQLDKEGVLCPLDSRPRI